MPDFSNFITEYFSKEKLERMAREHGFVQRKSQLNATKFVDLLMFCDQQLDHLSLKDLADTFGEQHGTVISKQALQERFNENAVSFMVGLLSEMLSCRLGQLPCSEKGLYSRFNSVRIKDSTRYTLPEDYAGMFKGHGGKGSNAQISIQYEFDMLDNAPMSLMLTSACRNDQQDSGETLDNIQKNDLLIRDLGYVTQRYLKHVHQQRAYYINRLNPRWNVWDAEQKQIDFSKILKKINRHSLPYIELEVYIIVDKKTLPMRLIVTKIQTQAYEKRIQKAERSSHGRHQVSNSYRTKAWLNLFITNVPAEWMDAVQVQKAYGLRWQIELVFKVWKSQARIDKMKPMKIQRFQCQLIARLIWLLVHWQALRLVQQWLKSQGLGFRCSQSKFYKTAFRISPWLQQALFLEAPIQIWLQKLFHNLKIKYATETKKGQQNVYQTILSCLA